MRLVSRDLRGIAVLSACLALSGCATLLGGGSSQAVSVNSNPAGASFAIKSSSGLTMASGLTPQTVRLPRKNEYQIELTAPGYQAQSIAMVKGVNGWVFGNFIFGWIPGLIIDAVTGSMSKLEPSVVQVSLAQPKTGDASEVLRGTVKFFAENGKLIAERPIALVPAR